jgi:hypothetical protein
MSRLRQDRPVLPLREIKRVEIKRGEEFRNRGGWGSWLGTGNLGGAIAGYDHHGLIISSRELNEKKPRRGPAGASTKSWGLSFAAR